METRKSRASKKKHDFLRGVIGRMMIEQGGFHDSIFHNKTKQKEGQDACVSCPSFYFS